MTLDQLYDEHEATLYRFALRLTHDPNRADDLVQETLVRAMGHLALLAMLSRAQCRAWLNRTLKHLHIDEERKYQRQTTLLQSLEVEASVQQPAIQPGAEMGLGDPFEHVPERFRDVVEMHYRWGMTSQEIAEQLAIPAATVRSRLHLAIKEMRRKPHLFG